jgi:hypothetical protein
VQTVSFSGQNYTNIRKRNNEMHIAANKHEICLIHKGRSRTGYKFLTSALSSGHLNSSSSKLNNLSVRKGKIQVTCLKWKIAAPIYCSILNRRNGYQLSHHWELWTCQRERWTIQTHTTTSLQNTCLVMNSEQSTHIYLSCLCPYQAS